MVSPFSAMAVGVGAGVPDTQSERLLSSIMRWAEINFIDPQLEQSWKTPAVHAL